MRKLLIPALLSASTGTVSFVTVRTRAPNNPNPRIYYHVPYDRGISLFRRCLMGRTDICYSVRMEGLHEEPTV